MLVHVTRGRVKHERGMVNAAGEEGAVCDESMLEAARAPRSSPKG